MKRPYNDAEYEQWFQQFNRLVNQYLETEGNTLESLEDEFENAVENAEPSNDD